MASSALGMATTAVNGEQPKEKEKTAAEEFSSVKEEADKLEKPEIKPEQD